MRIILQSNLKFSLAAIILFVVTCALSDRASAINYTERCNFATATMGVSLAFHMYSGSRKRKLDNIHMTALNYLVSGNYKQCCNQLRKFYDKANSENKREILKDMKSRGYKF